MSQKRKEKQSAESVSQSNPKEFCFSTVKNKCKKNDRTVGTSHVYIHAATEPSCRRRKRILLSLLTQK